MATAALDKVGQNAWCREHGLYPSELERWRQDTEAPLDVVALNPERDGVVAAVTTSSKSMPLAA